jgi:DNA-directed RNA polymerase subunit beta'
MKRNQQTEQLIFHNRVINKRQLKNLMYDVFHNYGVVKSSIIADRIKNLTFHYATKSGISLSIEDLKVPDRKRSLIGLTNNEVETTEQNYSAGYITSVERFQKVIDIWNNASNFLKDEVVTYFRESDPMNPLYIMAFSGARGNISQVRQLVGMRGLMADPQGQIIDLPIKSNFREGLTVTEYIISSYGARKGLVDTALRTADSGYLTRRLVDVAQDIIVREEDCKTEDGLSKIDLFCDNNLGLSMQDRLLGRLTAEPLYSNDGKTLIALANVEITTEIIKCIQNLNPDEIKVRSPLTCNSMRSICRNCYGWNLAYSKIVDLGEAVGIIAAQSIGEPGTQLTMRTFHTGGVFSGDLTKQIRSPFQGTVSYQIEKNAFSIRTLHGEKGFKIKENLTLYLSNSGKTVSAFKIPQGTTLLVNSNQKVYNNQIIAEIKKDANLILEEDNKDVYTDIPGEVFFQGIKLEENQSDELIKEQSISTQITKNNGLVWVLNGERYSLPSVANLQIQLGEFLAPNTIIAQKQIRNNYPGIVHFNSKSGTKQIDILNFSLILKDAILRKNNNLKSNEIFLETINNKKFQLQVSPNEPIKHGQAVATLLDNTYKTKIGGTVTYNLERQFNPRKKRNSSKTFSGSLYFIPEETHELDNSTLIDQLQIKNGSFVEKGEILMGDLVAQTSGVLQIDISTQEIIIKPGELFKLSKFKIKKTELKNNFVKPGEFIAPNIIAQSLVYTEFIELAGVDYMLVRPVKIYRIPQEKGFILNHVFFPNINNKGIKLKTVKRVFFKNWERVKSNKSLNLIQTFLILDSENIPQNLQSKFEFIPIKNKLNCQQLKLSIYEILKIDETLPTYKSAGIETKIHFSTKEGQYVNSRSLLAQTEIFLSNPGTFVAQNKSNNSKEILILRDKDIKKITYKSSQESLCVKVGDLVRVGCYLTPTIKSEYSGQIYHINQHQIQIRLGRPYLISAGAILITKSGTLVQRSDTLATLVYEKLKTVDIVQGLPKVEEILEARKIKNSCLLAPHDGVFNLRRSTIAINNDTGDASTIEIDSKSNLKFISGDYVKLAEPITDGPVSPHDKLDVLFKYYQTKLTINEACRKSFKHLQLFLVNEVQRTYLSQNVQIADKHIEIIVKQMTSKVRIENSGDTTLLPGEILALQQAEIISNASLSLNEKVPFYVPILLGITKASLNSDSFISAASFQETTRILTEAAIEGKKDWLNGLKENVIIGRLIPAGTGFNYYKKEFEDEFEEKNKKKLFLQRTECNIRDQIIKSKIKERQ